MISYLKGELTEKNPAYCVIDCGGVGYFVQISMQTYSKLPDNGTCKLMIYYSVSVDVRSGQSNHNLYGFVDVAEKEMFKLLITVSGVSANTARMILSSLTPSEVQSAILTNNVTLIKSVKGIGPKLAEKIISELKNKVDKEDALQIISAPQHNTIREEALSALLALGFDKLKSGKLLDGIIAEHSDLTVEELIKQALKRL